MNFSSQEFLDKLKIRDNEAVSALVEAYHEVLFRAALKQGLGEDQSDEVVQGTWSTFFEKIENFEGRSHVRTYLFGILYNKIKEIWRSNKKYTHDYSNESIESIFKEDHHFVDKPKEPDQWIESNQFLEILEEELEKLPNTQRMAFYLKEVEGETTENICKIMDITSTNLGVLIFRAKNNLRLKLEDRLNK